MSTQSGTSSEALPLPKGGGSSRGLGDGFTPDLNRGTGSYSIEIELPDGYRNLKPQLSLSYNSANGDGPFGYGWALPKTRIQLNTDVGAAAYQNPEYLLNGKKLVPTGGGSFQHQVENAFHRVQKKEDGWVLTDRRGNVTELGTSPASRISGSVAGKEQTFAWLVERVTDTSGNEIQYKYLRDGGELYLDQVSYAVFTVDFQYEVRHDPFTNRRPGFPITRRLRCSTIEVRRPSADHPLIRRYNLEYTDQKDRPSILERVTMEGFKRQPDGTVQSDEAPEVEMTYTPFNPGERRLMTIANGTPSTLGALGREGRELVDINGDGLPDIIQMQNDRSFVWKNKGDGSFGPPQPLDDLPGSSDGITMLMDADGNGTVDVMELRSGRTTYYPNNGNGSFSRPRYLGQNRQPLGFDPADPNAAVADINGDGIVDLVKTSPQGLVAWKNKGGEEGFDLPKVTPQGRSREELPDVRLSDPTVSIADMTGDGLPDIVHIVRGLVEFWPGLGEGQYGSRQSIANPPQLPKNYDPERVYVADVDGTGSSDIVYVGMREVYIWRNLNGNRFADPTIVPGTPYAPVDSIRLVDLLGTGNTGILWSDVQNTSDSGYRYLSFADTKPYLLTRINSGTGSETQILYNSSTDHAARDANRGKAWNTQLPMPVPVVHRIIRKDLVSDVSDTTDIYYHKGRWDSEARQFRGFGRVTTRQQAGKNGTPKYEEHHFLIGAPDEPPLTDSSEVKEKSAKLARRGQVYRTVYHDGEPDGTPLRIEESHWNVTELKVGIDNSPILFPHVSSTVVRNLEGDDHPRITKTDFEYDNYGNVIRQLKQGSAPNGDDEGNAVDPITVESEVEYAINKERYVVDRVARVVQRDGSGNVLGEVRHYYDGDPFDGLPLGEVGVGLLRRQEELILEKDSATALYGSHEPNWSDLGYHSNTRIDGKEVLAVNKARFDHSSHGMVTTRRGPMGHDTHYEYDEDGLLISRITNPAGHEESASWDPSWQVIDKRSNVTGQDTHYTYDGQGRMRSIVRPGDSLDKPTIRYEYKDDELPRGLHIRQRRRSGQTDVYEHAVYFDGSGNKIQKRSRVDDNRVRVSGTMQFNQRGDVIAKGSSYFSNGLAFEEPEPLSNNEGVRYQYDSINRLISATRPSGDSYHVTYTPWSAIHEGNIEDDDDIDSRARTEHFDPLGRLSGITREDSEGTQFTATYTRDPLGRVVATKDMEGRSSFREIVLDAAGNKLRIDHATAGKRTAVYNARGRAVRYWDDREQVVKRDYDKLDRLKTVTVNEEVTERFHYDQDPQEKGRLSRVEDEAGSVTFEYDQRGRIVGKDRTINGDSYNIGYEYDPAGKLRALTYPNGKTANFERWDDSRIQSVDGLVDELQYDAHGHLTKIEHANGVREKLSYNTEGKMESIRTTKGDNVLYEELLSFGASGHLTKLESTMPDGNTEIETFSYDDHGFLTEAKKQQNGTAQTWKYNYDAAGNILRGDEMGIESYQYSFDEIGALESYTPKGEDSKPISFDQAGHLTDLENMSLEYDARGRLVQVTKEDGTTVKMTYDYRGARVAKEVNGPDGSWESRYVDELYEERAGVDTAYVMAGGRLIGHLRGDGKRHLHTDYRGTVVLVTKPSGTVDGRFWLGPYGSASASSGTEDPSRGYTGAIFDPETGLFYMNQRFYCPKIGRFLAPDPVYLGEPEHNLDKPIAHNLYVYARSNPAEYVDPTGQQFWETVGAILGGIVVAVATLAAVALAATLLVAAAPFALAGAAIGAIAGGIAGGWEGAAMGAMMGATIGINIAIAGPVIGGMLGIVHLMGLSPEIRNDDWYKSLAGWSSWLAPASWPGHILGLGVFLANGIAHIFGSDEQIERVEFDWQHGQIQTVGGEYGGGPYPWLGFGAAPAHNVGAFSFFDTPADFDRQTREHETGHMISNFSFGFWQGIVNAIENGTAAHNDRFFEKIAESNVNPGDRDLHGTEIPYWA